MRELSLPAKAYLLSCDVARQRVRDRDRAGYLMRAAALAELVLRGRLIDHDGMVQAVPGGSAGDLLRDEVQRQVATDRPRTWRAWVRRDGRDALRSQEEQLAAAGLVDIERGRVFLLLPRHRVTVRDEAVVSRLAGVVDQTLRGGGDVERISREDAALTALVTAVELKPVVSARDRRQYKDRLRQLEERGGAAVPALRKVFKELQAVRHAAAHGHGGS
ncbi:GOLPH3/VPS74 family protein [Amycolatopsis suaedae]|uniref:GPP34 family phosphoprotein n=1 Tax=Amycolatopsis suaedae TaxID=2510978 RepID=A0A4Q7IXT4_9PSEU|nr:GPP34 family phosphoprotein [Amycolatopsis suaedae]RZQ59761.1 GPP34 family phosphoprotein [Amycolatopsis suaedae]